MSGPWEKYATETAEASPWEKYAPAESAGAQDWEPRQFTQGEKIKRKIGLAAQGFNDSVANTVGAPVDLAAWGLRQIGVDARNPIGGSESIKKGIDYVATLPGRVMDAPSQGVNALVDDRTSRLEPAGQGERIANMIGQGTGAAASVFMPASVIANAARPGTAVQGVSNVLRQQPVTQTVMGATGGAVEGATDSTAAGLAASLAVPLVGSAVRRAVTPFPSSLTAQENRLAAAAANEGIPLTPAQSTGSGTLKVVENALAKLPGSRGPMGETLQGQRQQFNRAALERAGVTADNVSPEVLDRAFVAAGQTFDDLAARTTLNVDRQFAQDVGQAINNYGRRLPTDIAPVFRSYIDDLTPAIQAAANGQSPQIAGDIYAAIRSDIGKRIRASHNRPELQEALGALQTALDGAVERSTSGALRNEWQEARRQYQALMTIDKAAGRGTQADRAAGNLPFAGFKEATRQADPRGYARGRGQMNELSRVGDFLADKIPDSGTPTRGMVANPLMWPVIPALNVLARGYTSGPGQAYLSNQVAGRTNYRAAAASEAARRLMDQNENALVGAR